jgi:hypothetical protein
MIRAAVQTDKGPIALIGINYDNMIRMKAGLPLDIDLKAITPPGKRMTRVIVHYAHTYEQVVRDMAKGGIPVNAELLEYAQDLDEQLKKEKRANS